MPKTKVQKQAILKDLDKYLAEFKSVVFADYKGLTVSEASQIRRICKQNKAKYIVAKKTLIQKALEKADLKDVNVKDLQGNLAMIIGFEDEITPAKVAANFGKEHKNLKLLGGIMENKYIDLAKVEALALIPSKLELLSKLVGSINAPVSGFVNVLAANIRGLVNVLGAIKGQKV